LGLDAARRYAQIAPSAPHAQHMPSHIFIRLGLWDESIAANQRSLDAGIEYARAQHLKGVAPEPFHAPDHLVYGYLQERRDAAGPGDPAQARVEIAALATIAAALAGQPGYNWSRVVSNEKQAVTAWVLLAAGDTAGALREAAAAADREDVTAKHPVTPGELL